MSSSIPPPSHPSLPPVQPFTNGDRPGPDSQPASGERQWRLWIAPAALVLGFGIGELATIFIAIIGHAAGASLTNPPPSVEIIGNVVFDLSFVVAALYMAGLHGRPRPSDFGYRRISLRTGFLAFLAAGVGYYLVTVLYAAIFNLHGAEKLPKQLGVTNSTAAAAAVTVFVCVIAPVAEEFFFRGFLFGVLRRWRIMIGQRNIGVWVAAILTGILFGLAHTGSAQSQDLIPLGFLGFVLCLVRWRTGSLYPCIALHSFNNALAISVNQFHWSAGEVVGLIIGSLFAVGALTLPLAAARPQQTV